MANTSIGGLVSGLDTATIISQLMQLEARPQTMLKTRMGLEQKANTSLQALNAKLAAIATKAADLVKQNAWTATKATSSNDKVTVTTDAGATTASLDLSVVQLATPYRVDYGLHAKTDLVTGNGSNLVKLTVGPDTLELDTKDGTVSGLVDAINAKGAGVTATLVGPISGAYRLQMTTTATGASAGFTLTDSSNGALTINGTPTPGQPAKITVGADTIESDSNTFTDLMPGVDVTLLAGAKDTATITVATDSQSLADKVKAMVDAVNAALDDVSTLTGYNSATKTAGTLAGDSTLRDVRNQLLSAVTGGVDGKSLAPYGVQTDRTGKLVFDADKFKAAYAADPTGTAAKFTEPEAPSTVVGFAANLRDLAKSFSDSVDGTVTSAIKGRTSLIDRMEDDVADWDVRLEQRRANLQRQYGALEVALGKLQSQSSWLAGQISSLPKMSG